MGQSGLATPLESGRLQWSRGGTRRTIPGVIDTTRIQTGFDVEVQFGGGWFRVALQTLADHGLLLPDPPPPPIPPGAQVEITDVEVIADPDWHLRADLTVDGFPISLLAALALSADGTELLITTNFPGVGATVPFGVLDGLAAPPTLTRVPAEGGFAAAMALLANLDLQAGPQDEEPLPDGEFLPRGDATLAQSFLPPERDVAVGVGAATFPRFANDTWHTTLRADDGSHPFPDQDDRQGTWENVTVAPRSGSIRTTLVAEVKVDSPWIDVVPDPTITIDIDLTPRVVDGEATFAVEVHTDVDFGLLGDLLAGIVGGLIGLVIGLIAGGPFIGAGIGFAAGVIILEVGEAIVEGILERKIRASLEDRPLPPVLACDSEVVVEATPEQDEGGIVLGALGAIPRSIPIHIDRPDALHERRVVVSTAYEEVEMNSSGMALAGTATPAEVFSPLRSSLVGRNRENGDGALRSLVYRAADGTRVELPLEEVRARMTELVPPLELIPLPGEATIRVPGEKLASVCVRPTGIRRQETVVTEIRFSTGLDLRVPEAVALQDAGAIVLSGFQLIHPSNAHPYFRAVADDSTDNNFESLPDF